MSETRYDEFKARPAWAKTVERCKKAQRKTGLKKEGAEALAALIKKTEALQAKRRESLKQQCPHPASRMVVSEWDTSSSYDQFRDWRMALDCSLCHKRLDEWESGE